MPRAFLDAGVDDGVRAAFDEAVEALRASGAVIVDVDLPHARYATPTFTIVAMAEASSNLGRYDGVRYGHRGAGAASLNEMYTRSRAAFGSEVKRRLMLGTYVLSGGYYDEFYARAQKVRALLRQEGLRQVRVQNNSCLPMQSAFLPRFAAYLLRPSCRVRGRHFTC